MFKFIKKLDENNKYDNVNIVFEIPQSDLTITELRELFDDFCRACGYNIPHDEELNYE